MDNNNWRPTQSGGEPAMDGGGDWRSQLQADSRQRIVTKIMNTLKRHLPFSGQEGLQEIEKIAVRFEEKIYTAATSQSDYLRKISLKMLTMEARNPMPNALQSNSSNNGQNPPDPDFATELDEGEVCNPGPITPVQGLMDNNNWRPTQSGGEPAMDAGGDWRSRLQPDSRQRIVTKIMDTLKRHLPFSGQEGLQEIEKIAVRFEEKIYTAATSQSDYLRKISLKMLTMETKNPMPNALQSNTSNNGQNPLDPDFATELDEGEVCNPGPITPVQFL